MRTRDDGSYQHQRTADGLTKASKTLRWSSVREKSPGLAGKPSLPEAYSNLPPTDLGGKGVLPGLIDSHTHLIWAGDRIHEYEQRFKGETYESILEAGGGIYNTVRATQAASEEALLELAVKRAEIFLRGGVTTLEVKSGYGLEPEHELKMLRVARALKDRVPQRIVPTLLAHVVPKGWDRRDYVTMFCTDLIPEVARQGLAEAVDVFCDRGAFTVAETRQIFEAALANNLNIKAHAEQLEHTGATKLVAEMGGLSADHLERCSSEDWKALAESGTVGTVLPGATVILKKPFPDCRAAVDAGVKLAVATDFNPGSSPLNSMFLALQLAMALGDLSLPEALAAGTKHAADALGHRHSDLGRLEPGCAADFIVMNHANPRYGLYSWGHAEIAGVYCAGIPCAGVAEPVAKLSL